MRKINTKDLFTKLDSLTAVFKDAQKLIPIVQNLIEFMGETIPLLDNINKSVHESTFKIPRATNQINDVTSATEMATTEILDIVDVISNDIYAIEIALSELIAKEEKRADIINKIKFLTKDNDEIKNLFNEYDKIDAGLKLFPQMISSIKKIRDDAYNITLSLQVQDITTQQLAAVNHLIESVHEKLASIIVEFEDAAIENIGNDFEFSEEVAFNPDAVYSKSKQNQELVDDLMKEGSSITSQDEIDKLFLK